MKTSHLYAFIDRFQLLISSDLGKLNTIAFNIEVKKNSAGHFLRGTEKRNRL